MLSRLILAAITSLLCLAISSKGHAYCVGCWPPPPDDDPPPAAPASIAIANTMFIPLDHVRLPSYVQLSPVIFFGADNKITHNPGDTSFRIQQLVQYSPSTQQLLYGASSGVTRSYLPSVNLTTTINCTRKFCSGCPTYGGTQDIVYKGRCRTGAFFEEALAGGMDTITASIVSQSSTSVTIRFSGEPFNSLYGASQFFGDIDWSHELTVDWSSSPTTWTLQYEHDGFPYHDIRLNNQLLRGFDPILNGQTPLSLGSPAEWQGQLSGTLQ